METRHLIQILLPLTDNQGTRFPRESYSSVAQELTERFGGVTAFTRSPAKGFWEEKSSIVSDEVVLFEVVAETLDEAWWRTYRDGLEKTFRQDEIMIRVQAVAVLGSRNNRERPLED